MKGSRVVVVKEKQEASQSSSIFESFAFPFTYWLFLGDMMSKSFSPQKASNRLALPLSECWPVAATLRQVRAEVQRCSFQARHGEHAGQAILACLELFLGLVVGWLKAHMSSMFCGQSYGQRA